MAAASEPADREELKNSPFSKGEWPVAFDIDVGYDRLRELLQSGEDEGFMSLTSKHLLAIAYSAGQHESRGRARPRGDSQTQNSHPPHPFLVWFLWGGTESLFFQAQARRDDDTTRGVAVDGDVRGSVTRDVL